MKRQRCFFLLLAAVLVPAMLNAQVQAFQTGWWWNPAQPGTGYFLEQQSNSVFVGAAYYADSGEATWAVSTGSMSAGTYSGALNAYTAQPATGSYQGATLAGALGNVRLQFSDPNHATLTGPGGSIPIQRFSFTNSASAAAPQPGSPQSGWWWDSQQGGRGFAMEFQGSSVFIAALLYDAAGNPTWYASLGAMTSPTLYQGTWTQYGGGQTLTGAWKQNTTVNASAGPLAIQFSSPTAATMTLPDGSEVALTRFNWAANTSTTIGVPTLYSGASFWNQPIGPNAAVDGNSSSMVTAALANYSSSANFANTDAWGIALAYSSAGSSTYNVLCTMYCTTNSVLFAIPAGAQPTTGSDHHLAVISGAQELDMWKSSYDAATNTWSAGTTIMNDATGWGASCGLGLHCNGAVAAGFALLGGAIRPEEIAQGHIDHALALTTPYTRSGYIACPATHTDGKFNDVSALPEGALVQLDPAFNVDAQSWPAWEKVVAKALQQYGAYVADTGGSVAIRGVADLNLGSDTWAAAGTPKGASLSNLPWSSFRVLAMQSCN
jgi:hypothetical protein